jgi:tetratricopeptide (TPR) repeat protein
MLETGRERLAAGDPKAAEALYRAALAADPQSGPAHAALSRLHLDLMGHDEEALSEAQEAIRLAPEDAAGWTALAYALGRNRRGPEALEAALKAVALKEHDAAAHAALAEALLRQRQLSGALNAARRAVQVDAGSPEAYLSLADCYEAAGDFARAKAAMEKAVSLEPLNLMYETRLAQLLAGMGLYDAAGSALQAVIERAGKAGLDYLPALGIRAYLALVSGDIPAADEQAGELLRLWPTDVDARLVRARLDWRRGDYRAAEAAYREAIQGAPGNFDARLGLARLQLDEDQCAAAADTFRTLAAEQPRLASPLIGGARAASCVEDTERAVELFKQAIDLEPCNAEAFARLGSLYAGQGRWDEAQEMFSRSWRCSASGADVQIEAGIADLTAGDPAAALAAFTLAQQLDPAAPRAQLGLCVAYQQAGDAGRALIACDQAGKDPVTGEGAALPRAAALIDAGRFAEAAASLQSLAGRLSGEPGFHGLMGIAHIGVKDYRAALADFVALGRSTDAQDARLGGLRKALESGWELAPDAAQARLRDELSPIASRRPVSFTIESGAGGQTLSLQMAALPGEAPKATLDDSTALMVSAARVAPRIAPPLGGGIEVRITGAGGEPLYALRATSDLARQLATLQASDDEFVRNLRLASFGETGALTADEVEAIGAKVARLHNWSAPSAIPLVRLTPQDYARQLSAGNVATSLQRADSGALEVLLGLLEPGADATQLQIDVNSSTLAGFYDQNAKALALIDRSAGTWADRLTIAHECVHALQDREFASAHLSDSAASEDMRVAVRALVEGDAELSEAAYLQAQIPVDEGTFWAWTAGEPAEQEPGAAPPFMAALSAFPYNAGLAFVRSAYSAGGWPAVDQLFANPPVSTEQVLHPDLYRSGHLPVAVALPPLASKLGGDWGVVETGVMGEARWRMALAPVIGGVPAAAAAKGWGGDRYALLRMGSSNVYAAAFETAWDDRGEAGEFAELIGTWLDRRTGYGQVVSDLLAGDPDRHWVQGQLHWFVRRERDRVTIVVAPGAELAGKLLEAGYPNAYECRADVQAPGDVDQLLGKLGQEIEAQGGVGVLRARAGLYLQTGDVERAIADLDRAIDLDGHDAGAYVDRGRAHYAHGDYDAAVADLTRGLELRPGDYTAYLYLGRAYAAQEDYGRAEQTFADAAARYPRDSSLRERWGDVYWSRNDYARALIEYRAAADLLPDFGDPDCRKALLYNVQGHLQQDQGNYDEAVAAFGQGLELWPEDTQGWYDRASAYSEKGDYDKAAADYGRAIELAPENAEGYYGRGSAYLQRGFANSDAGQAILSMGDFARAITDCDKAIELDPKMGQAYFRRGQAYHARGDRSRAIADYTKALELLPEWSEPYRVRGYAYADQGEKALAIRDFEKYLEMSQDEASRAEVEQDLQKLRSAP